VLLIRLGVRLIFLTQGKIYEDRILHPYFAACFVGTFVIACGSLVLLGLLESCFPLRAASTLALLNDFYGHETKFSRRRSKLLR